MSEQKFCCNCKNFGLGADGARCNRVVDHKTDLVWGATWVCDQRPCHEIRADESSCGSDGKYFEAKEDPPKSHAETVARILNEAAADHAANKKPDWPRIKRYFT